MISSLSLKVDKIRQYVCRSVFKPKCDNVFGYALLKDSRDFAVYERIAGRAKVEAAFGNTVVLSKRGKKLVIYPDSRYPMIRHLVHFNSTNFPDLISGSAVAYCAVLPYMRWVTPTRMEKALRVIVVTDKAQIYHNFPARRKDCDGFSKPKDVIRFEESVVWDLPERRYPSADSNCAEYERYFPGLPKEAYTYHPASDCHSKYGNEGFSTFCKTKEGVLPRFYIPQRKSESNPFFYMSGFEADYKLSLIGTYRSNVECGVRTCVFASSDGGRQWFCKYEFGDLGEYEFQQGSGRWGHNFGNPIVASSTGEIFSLRKRLCVIPSKAEPDPKEKFRWGNAVDFHSVADGKALTLVSSFPHGLTTGNIVAVSTAPEQHNWMLNDKVDACSAGNGLLFKVECPDEKTVRLYELCTSAHNPISCRHIHHINRVRDGYVIGTGEIYPNSWLLYLQMREADTFTVKNASDAFDIYRFNSSENSVQRTLGFLWKERNENTILFASDHDILEKDPVSPISGRSLSITRGATGVYSGKLSDIDDIDSFVPVFEAKEPAYLLRDLGKAIVFSGQRGELALSFDGGENWQSTRLPAPLNHPKGGNAYFTIYSDLLLHIK